METLGVVRDTPHRDLVGPVELGLMARSGAGRAVKYVPREVRAWRGDHPTIIRRQAGIIRCRPRRYTGQPMEECQRSQPCGRLRGDIGPSNRDQGRVHKLMHLVGGDWSAHSYPPVYRVASPGDGARRVIAGAPSGEASPFERLVSALVPPYSLLYVLHTPRGEGEPGRYESAPLSAESFRVFMARFGRYLASDARFDLWAYSSASKGTVVWDRHDLLFAYGPVERFTEELRQIGFSEGEAVVPVPHQHYYWAEFDTDAADLLRALAWSHSPLEREDEQ